MDVKNLKTSKNKQISGPLIINPIPILDERGYFYESWNQHIFDSIVGKKIRFKQDNISYSKKGVLRGLHYQLEPKSQGKLIRCSIGEIFDVAVDLRRNSPTFKDWASIKLSEKNKVQLWIPNGFAHGFLTLSEHAEVNYKVNNYWSKEHERSIRWNDNFGSSIK